MTTETPKVAKENVHHWQLRNKHTNKFLTNDDVYPERDDVMGDQVILVLEEQKAHNLRHKYETEFRAYGADPDIECVGFDSAGHELCVS